MDLKSILLHYVLPLIGYGIITGIANLILSRKSQIELWAEAHPKAAGFQKLLRAVGLDPFALIAAISLWSTSKLPDAQRSEGLKKADPKFPKPPSTPSGMGGMLALCLCFAMSLAACSWFTHSVEPVIAHCEPSPAALVAQVEQILISGGDYTKELEQLAVADTAQAVECAVQAAIAQLANKVGADSNAGPAVERGKAYLAAHKGSK